MKMLGGGRFLTNGGGGRGGATEGDFELDASPSDLRLLSGIPWLAEVGGENDAALSGAGFVGAAGGSGGGFVIGLEGGEAAREVGV